MLKGSRSLTSLSRKTGGSKISLGMENMSDSDDESSSMDADEEDADQDPNETLTEALNKHGFNAKKLLGVNILKDDSGESYNTYNPPLITSLFDNVPPVINFATSDERRRYF